MHRKDRPSIAYIYENDDVIKGNFGKEITDSTQGKSSEYTGSDSVRNRSSRVAAVCLVLLCVLLLTAVILLCVKFIQERQLLTNERDQLRNHLQSSDGWTYYKSSFYYMPNETKNWTESRRYCTERGADLIIINNSEEQDFVKNMTGKAVWIGLTDSVEEGRWKWVDGTNMTSNFWASGEPNGGSRENCVLTVAVPTWPGWGFLKGWCDYACTAAYQWICEKSISQLTLP